MSMWEYEALGQSGVIVATEAPLSNAEKRAFAFNAFALINHYDVGYIAFREASKLIDCGYLVRVDPAQLGDKYKLYKSEYSRKENGEYNTAYVVVDFNNIEKRGPEGFYLFSETQLEAIVQKSKETKWYYPPSVYVIGPKHQELQAGIYLDAQHQFLSEFAESGLISDEYRNPIQEWNRLEAIRKFMELTVAQNSTPTHLGFLMMLYGFVYHELMLGSISPAELLASKEQFTHIFNQPMFSECFSKYTAMAAEKSDDWVLERFSPVPHKQSFADTPEQMQEAASVWFEAAKPYFS